MKKIALGVEYNGANYHGWQRQRELNTVQQVLETAISAIACEPIKVYCSGRTDAAVHAVCQIVHFETTADRDWRAWVYGVNSHLPVDINVRFCKEMGEAFHARFSATGRRYRYLIYNNNTRTSLLSKNMTWFYHSLDETLMQKAANDLLGEHDFNAYRAVGCQAKSSVRTLRNITITRQENTLICDFAANGFLYHMVRNIMGVLMSIGQGKKDVSFAKTVLEGKKRSLGGVTAPPYGLYFVCAEYPGHFGLPQVKPPLIVL
jgi:tRNA pseudouridine38-40 synthase